MRIMILLSLIVISTVSLTSALSDSDKSMIEMASTTVLMKADVLSYGLAEVDYGDRMNVWYIPKGSDQDAIFESLGYVVGVYVGTCKMYPEISDMKLMMGTKDNVVGEMYCERSWADEVREDSDGSFNSNDLGLVGLKVMGTFKKTS
jgi:hypothetical protein